MKNFMLCLLFAFAFTIALKADIVVNTTADENNGDTSSVANLIANPGGSKISLREALLAIDNGNENDCTITFDPAAFPVGGTATINVTGIELPSLVESGTVIDGTGAGVTLDGFATIDTGLIIAADNFQVKGLTVKNFEHNGIHITSSVSGTIEGNVIGACYQGIYIQNCIPTQPLVIKKNYIGTDKIWNNIGNPNGGLRIEFSKNILVGGLTPGDGNYFGFNFAGLVSTRTDIEIYNNYFGTNPLGGNIGNTIFGLKCDSHPNGLEATVTIGAPNAGNIFAFNGSIEWAANSNDPNTNYTYVIQGNYIGTDLQRRMLSSSDCLTTYHSTSTGTVLIGGRNPGEGNVFANAITKQGRSLSLDSDAGPEDVIVEGNYFGTNQFGDVMGGLVAIEAGGGLIGSANPTVNDPAANVIANYALGLNLGNQATCRGNSIYSNGTAIISTLAAPTILSATSGNVTVSTGVEGATVDLYSNPLGEAQARKWIASGVTDVSGEVTLTNIDFELNKNLTATVTANNLTSALSPALNETHLSNVVVTTEMDLLDGDTSSVANLIASPGPDGVISLREALAAVNNGNETDCVINFDENVFPIANPVAINITGTELPSLSQSGTIIDAISSGVILDGLSNINTGLIVAADNFQVKGLTIKNFASEGILISSSISGNIEDNVIGSCTRGIFIQDCDPSEPLVVKKNYIGCDKSFVNIGNSNDGVRVEFSSNVEFGGLNPGDGNYFGFNLTGLHIVASSASAYNNYIGVSDLGTNIGNTVNGLRCESHGAELNSTFIIGAPNAGNIIAFNDSVELNADLGIPNSNYTYVIQGNYIGTDPQRRVLSASDCVVSYHPTATGTVLIGGRNPGEGNVFANATTGQGRSLSLDSDAGPEDIIVEGNYFGTNQFGDVMGGLVAIEAGGGLIGSANPIVNDPAANIIANCTLGLNLGNQATCRGNSLYANGTAIVSTLAAPTILSATGGNVTVSTGVEGAIVDLYANPFGEEPQARKWIASGVTDVSGQVVITSSVLQVNHHLTATATVNNLTSAVSTALTYTGFSDIAVNTEMDILDGDASSLSNLIATPGPDGLISLREALLVANVAGDFVIGFDEVIFPSESPATIQVTGTPLSAISNSTIRINAEDRGVILDGSSLTNGVCLDVQGSAYEIFGLTIKNFDVGILVNSPVYGLIRDNVLIENTTGIRFEDVDETVVGTVVVGNYFGTDSTWADLGNTEDGIFVDADSDLRLQVGGSLPQERNYFGFQGKRALYMESGELTFQGNFVGTNESGDDLGNFNGVVVKDDVTAALIGGPNLGEGNVIGFTQNNQVVSTMQSGTFTVQGNSIGAMEVASNWMDIGGQRNGISIGGSSSLQVFIGGLNPNEGNIIGYHDGPMRSGIELGRATAVIQGNYIGTNSQGDNLGNTQGLKFLLGAGDATVEENTFGFSLEDQISYLANSGVQTIRRNYIGVTKESEGWLNVGGQGHGITILASHPSGPTIGGILGVDSNYIAHHTNEKHGIFIDKGHAVIQGNYIGTNENGDNLSNTNGIAFEGAITNFVVGSPDPGSDNSTRNVIARNNKIGVSLMGTGLGPSANLDKITIRGNSIHTNGNLGIDLMGSANNNIKPPTLESAVGTTVSGSEAASGALIDIYTNPIPQTEARQWIASGVADAAGKFQITGVALSENQNITVTQTDQGRTSEISNAVKSYVSLEDMDLFIGAFNREDLDSIIYGGNDFPSSYLPGNPQYDTLISIVGASEADLSTSAFGTEYHEGNKDLTPNQLFSTAPLPLNILNDTQAGTSLEYFILSDEQQGVSLNTSANYANTQIRVEGTYEPNGIGTISWTWNVRPEPEQKDLSPSSSTNYAVFNANETIASFEITEASQSGIFLESFRVRLTEGNPGALSALSNLRIYLDSGSSPNEWDPGDVLVSGAIPTPLTDNTLTLNQSQSVISETKKFLVVSEVDPSGFDNPQYLTVAVNFDETAGRSLLHNASLNWQNSENVTQAFTVFEFPGDITVNTPDETPDGGDASGVVPLILNPGSNGISLSEAITAVLADPMLASINFDPAVFPPGSPQTISLTTAYDSILRDGVIIDASNAGVILDGSALSVGSGLNFNAENCEVYGLQIQNFPAHGIRVSGRNVTIGGGGPGQGNVIVSNQKSGIFYKSTSLIPTKIFGNLIGTDASGADLGNTLHGITVQGSGTVQIGSGVLSERNIIAFHNSTNRAGIHLIDGNVSIYGNLIGTNTSSSSGFNMGNYYGIQINDGVDSINIGGPESGQRNTIVHSLIDQIHINLSPASSGAVVNIKNNLIGTGDSYDVPKGSGQDGIHAIVNGNHSVTIGGTGLNEGNEIGYQARGGIALVSSSQSVTVQGNHIGVSRTGVPMPNLIGLGFVESGNQLVGSLDPSIDNDGANTIAHNTTWGILGIGNGSVFNEFRGNAMHSNGIAAVSHTVGSNFEIPPPLLNAKLDQNRVSGSIVFPQFAADTQVDIFRNNPGENQQREYVGQATVFTIGPNIGDFEFDIPNLSLGDNYTAVMTILSNTSAPASSISVPAFQATQSSALESDGSFSITGTALPNATIHLIIDGVIVATTTADSDGNYSFNLNINLGALSYTIEMVLDDGQTFSLDSDILYSGHARVFGFDRHYRIEDFIRGLQTTELSEALNDFEANVDLNDGDDYEVHLHDAANNIIDITREDENHVVTNGPMNEIQSIGTFRTNVQYDTIGRLTSYTETVNSNTRHYRLTWNYRDQLSLIESSSDGVNYSPVSAYAYYPTGMRSSKYVFATNKRQNYYGVNNQICEVYEFDGILGTEPSGPTQEFIYEGLDKPIAMFTNADGNGFTGAKGGREVYFYHCNPKGDVYALTAGEDTDDFNEGDVVERYDYSLFGDTYVMNAAYQLINELGQVVTTQQESKSAFKNPFQFAGAWKDDESCYMYMRHRYYDSRQRGFLSRDPIAGFPLRDIGQEYYLNDPTSTGSLGNLYAYVENNPGTFMDPLGLEKSSCSLAAVLAFVAVDVGVLEPSDLVPWKWVGYGVAIGGAYFYKEHTKNKSKSKWDKHTKKKSGGKEKKKYKPGPGGNKKKNCK